MDTITFEEFSKIPKRTVGKRTLEVGKDYYIQESMGKRKTVYKGTFSGTNEHGDYNNFKNIEFVVNPFRKAGKPFGFNNKSGFKFLEVIEPTSKEKSMKNKTIKELNEFISEQKMVPIDSTPGISFFGEDYRTARDSFNKRKTRRSSSSSKSSGRGIKKTKVTKKGRKSRNKTK